MIFILKMHLKWFVHKNENDFYSKKKCYKNCIGNDFYYKNALDFYYKKNFDILKWFFFGNDFYSKNA